MPTVVVIHGPNLNLLGLRRPEVYGHTTLERLDELIAGWAEELGLEAVSFQSNHEGEIIDRIHEARTAADAVVINPGAFTHYSYAIRDAIEAVDIPVLEVHISNIKEREEWRRNSVVAQVCTASIYGRGIEGYRWALRHVAARRAWPVETVQYGEDDDHVADLRLPEGEGPHPVAVVVHGGFWRDQWQRDTMDALAVDLTGRGWATWNIEYRRVGGGGGWPLTFEDVAAAIDSLASITDPRLDLARVTAIGHSAGGQLALWAAGRHRLPTEAPGAAVTVPVTSVIGLAAVASLGEAHRRGVGAGAVEALMRRGPGDARYHAADPALLLPTSIPTTLIHGGDDSVVPPAIAAHFVAAASAAGQSVDYVELPGIGHMELIEPGSAAWPAVVAASAAG